MRSVIITGGIATGKSTVTGMMTSSPPVLRRELFDADQEVHHLLTKPEVVRLISKEFGSSVIDTDGRVARHKLREIVFGDPESRLRLEAILHPMVLERCIEAQAEAHRSGAAVFLADIPLYFESKGFDVPDVIVVVIATDRSTQIRRLLQRSNLTQKMADMMIKSQMPLELKMQRADHVLWNAGSTLTLEQQVGILNNRLSKQ